MLDDFTAENGATGIIPGSHRFGRPPDLQPEDWPAATVIASGKKGSALLAKGPFWHTARPNGSAMPRSAVMVCYLRAFCIPYTDMQSVRDRLPEASAAEQRLYGAEQFIPERA
jgi:ectoine hydroxylase-related dioxygenase (phytanoyl-CoA dioxygenase family)